MAELATLARLYAEALFKAVSVSQAQSASTQLGELAQVLNEVFGKTLVELAKTDEKIELKVGESYPMKIIKLAPDERKIGLSIRALKSDEFRADWEAYQEGAGDGSATLGEHFRNR